MQQNNCIFCQIAKRERDAVVIYEDEYTMAFADLYPLMKGHTLVIPKKHFTNIYEIEEEEAAKVFKTTVKVSKKIKEILKPDGINIHQTNERAAGQEVFHLHIHIIPRYIGQRLFLMNIERKMVERSELLKIFEPVISSLNP